MLGLSHDVLKRCALFALAALLLTLAACGSEPAAPPHRLVAAGLRRVVAEEVVECRAFPAQVEARNSVTLASKLSGSVVEVFANEGDSLRAGDQILRIDDKDLRSRAQGLGANMNQAAMERQALEAKAAHARNNLSRLERLAAQKVISQDDFERAKSEYLSLQREQEAIAARERSVAFQKEELASLTGYTRINAPFDGVLSRRFVDSGAFVTAGQPLALVDGVTGGYDLAAQVDESLLADVRVGQTIVAAAPALTPEPFITKIGAVIGRIDPGTRTFRLKADIPDPAGQSRPRAGMFGRVFIPARKAAKILLPAECLRLRGELPAVFPVDDAGLIHLRIIKTGGAFHKVEFEGNTYITDSEAFEQAGRERFVEAVTGLAAGETLACPATGTMREGDRVKDFPK
jgi:RND family efflux transporter MFP subunit